MTSFKTLFLSFSSSSFLLFLLVIRAFADVTTCQTARCKPGGPTVHYPFRLRKQSRSSASHGGAGRFDLFCNNSKTVISLRSGSSAFTVEWIDYEERSIWINDPQGCLPRRFLNREFTNFTSDTFVIDELKNYTFLNCSADVLASHHVKQIYCLRGTKNGHAVVAVPTVLLENYGPLPSQLASPAPTPWTGCSEIRTALVPVSLWQFPWPNRFSDLNASVRLRWLDPDCPTCQARGGDCGLQSGSATETGRSASATSSGSGSGLPRSAKYGIIIGVGIPGLLCIIGLASYICGRVRACVRRPRPYSDFASSDTPESVVVRMGLDGPTIESFPKIELGESKRLPKPGDNTCPICLSEYQAKDTLRAIPECDHYFHVGCVDEWLKMNATCPLCRNSPDGSSHVSPSTSASTSSSSLSSP